VEEWMRRSYIFLVELGRSQENREGRRSEFGKKRRVACREERKTYSHPEDPKRTGSKEEMLVAVVALTDAPFLSLWVWGRGRGRGRDASDRVSGREGGKER